MNLISFWALHCILWMHWSWLTSIFCWWTFSQTWLFLITGFAIQCEIRKKKKKDKRKALFIGKPGTSQGHWCDGELWFGELICPLCRRGTRVETHGETAVLSIREEGLDRNANRGMLRWGVGRWLCHCTDVSPSPLSPRTTCTRDKKERSRLGNRPLTGASVCQCNHPCLCRTLNLLKGNHHETTQS